MCGLSFLVTFQYPLQNFAIAVVKPKPIKFRAFQHCYRGFQPKTTVAISNTHYTTKKESKSLFPCIWNTHLGILILVKIFYCQIPMKK